MDTYFSTDVETDGPIPGPFSLLSLGCAAYTPQGKLLGTFSANLEPLEGAGQDPDTMRWWAGQPEAWKAATYGAEPPKQVMDRFLDWVSSMGGRPVFVAYPAGFDFLFVYWYLQRFCNRSPFSFAALDIKTMAWAMTGGSYRDASKRNFPKRWMSRKRHTHLAVDDAIEQGEMFCNMLKELPGGL